MKKIPMRTCIMCKTKMDKRELLRIVRVADNGVEFDPTGKKNGRGAYLCTKAECIDNIRSSKKIAHALEINVDAKDLDDVITDIKTYLAK